MNALKVNKNRYLDIHFKNKNNGIYIFIILHFCLKDEYILRAN
jgi:hypothetical protein